MTLDQFQDSETVEQALYTPFLPMDAKDEIRSWSAQGLTAFQRVVPQMSGTSCKNCGDLGVVYVAFCKIGPFQTPRYANKVICWFDGGPRQGKGWYVIDHTIAYDCPNCSGVGETVKAVKVDEDIPF